jgi:drug/metabolite transporter (DMT)-like permease
MKRAHLAGIGFASIFGFSFLFSKIALEVTTPIGLISYRFLIAFLVFEVLRRLKIVKIRFQKGAWKQWLPVALFQPILYFLFETYGLRLTTSGEAGMMIAMIPILVTLLSGWLLRESPRLIQWAFIALSIGGILVVQGLGGLSASASPWQGFVLLGLAVLSAAFFNIASRKASRSVTPLETTYFMMASGALVFHLIYFVQLLMSTGLQGYVAPMDEIRFWIPLLYLGIVASIGGFFLVNTALKWLPAHVSSIYSNLSTVVAVAAGAIWLNEPLSWNHLVGVVMIVAGVYGTAATNRANKKPAS